MQAWKINCSLEQANPTDLVTLKLSQEKGFFIRIMFEGTCGGETYTNF